MTFIEWKKKCLQNIFCVPRENESQTGLELHEGEQMVTEFSGFYTQIRL